MTTSSRLLHAAAFAVLLQYGCAGDARFCQQSASSALQARDSKQAVSRRFQPLARSSFLSSLFLYFPSAFTPIFAEAVYFFMLLSGCCLPLLPPPLPTALRAAAV